MLTLLLTAFDGIAVSTTPTIAGAIMGVGATKRISAVRRGVAGTMVWAWILTILASAAVAERPFLSSRPSGRSLTDSLDSQTGIVYRL
jgi:PiT family inorganic phosphate transporter